MIDHASGSGAIRDKKDRYGEVVYSVAEGLRAFGGAEKRIQATILTVRQKSENKKERGEKKSTHTTTTRRWFSLK